MAAITLISKKKSSVGSPYAYYTFTAEEVSRTSTAVNIKLTATGWLQYSSSTFGSGLGLKAGVYIGGAWRTWTLKSTSSSWSGTTKHTESTTVSIPVSASVTSFTGIKVRVTRTDSNGSSCKLNETTATTSTMSIANSATFTITYDANGGTGAPASQTKAYNTSITLSSDTPTRADEGGITYTFLGWSTSSTATTPEYLAGSSYTANAGATLYAVWGETNGYFIIYNTDSNFTIPSQKKSIGEDAIITSEIPIKYGYTFVGWSTSANGTTVDYVTGDTYSIDNNIALYAVWTPWTHTVVFDDNGSVDDVGGIPESFTKTSGVDITISEVEPVKAGYIFNGWNTSSDGSGTFYYPNSIYSDEQDGGVVTLYAIWVLVEILLYTNGCCKALDFKEGAEGLAFTNDGTVESVEFIEGRTLSLDTTAFYLTEILEQHDLYKLTDESGLALTDELGNRLYYT